MDRSCSRRRTALYLFLLGMPLIAECRPILDTRMPRVTVSNPAVFTVSDVMEIACQDVAESRANGSDANWGPRASLDRYFLTKSADYPGKKLRIDELLDTRQRFSSYVQLITTFTELKLLAKIASAPVSAAGASTSAANPSTTQQTPTPTGGATPTATATPQKSDAATTTAVGTPAPAAAPSSTSAGTSPRDLLDLVDKLGEKLKSSAASDSPFDMLDRAEDMYTAYLVKKLKTAVDSNVREPACPAVQPSRDQQRLIYLVLQASVHPGTVADIMAGLRLRIVGVKLRDHSQLNVHTDGRAQLDRVVKILRITPQRTYDVDQVGFEEAIASSLSLAADVTAPLGQAGTIEGQATRKVEADTAARQEFLSRIGKQTAYLDGPPKVFGWNFYPINLQVDKVNAASRFVNWLVGTPRHFEVHGYLEGGTRDCAVVLLVKHDVEEIVLEQGWVTASMTGCKSGSCAAIDQTYSEGPIGRPLPWAMSSDFRDFESAEVARFSVHLPEYSVCDKNLVDDQKACSPSCAGAGPAPQRPGSVGQPPLDLRSAPKRDWSETATPHGKREPCADPVGGGVVGHPQPAPE